MVTKFQQETLKSRFAQAKVLVVGDVMLDRYWFGDVSRISPEAPVPVAKIGRIDQRAGGAANVARNIASLGGKAGLLSVTGDDEAADALDALMAQDGVASYLMRDKQIALFPTMTVRQNIELMPDILGWDKPKRTSRVNELLELVGMPPETYLNRYPHELSGGEQQRIGILRAIAAKPDILLMDEPFSALDPLARASLQETVSLIHKKLGTTIVFVTHDMNEAAKLACRIGVMHQGRLVQVDTPQDIQNHPADDYVRSLFGAAQPENTASAEEVINLYRRLDADGKARVREHWAKEENKEK